MGGLNTTGLSAHYVGGFGRQWGTNRFKIGVPGFVLSLFDRFQDALVASTETDLCIDPSPVQRSSDCARLLLFRFAQVQEDSLQLACEAASFGALTAVRLSILPGSELTFSESTRP